MIETFSLSFLSILLHIIIDSERQKFAKQKEPSNITKVLPLEDVIEDKVKETSETWIFKGAITLAKVCFPLLNILLISSFFIFGLYEYTANDGLNPIEC